MEFEISLTCSQDLLKVSFNIILPSMPRLFKWSLSLRFPDQNPLSIPLFPPYVSHSAPISFFLILIIQIIFYEGYKSWYPLTVQYPSAPCSSLLGPNTFLSTLSSHILTLCSSLKEKDQVSHPYKAKGKIIFVDIVTSMFLGKQNGKTKNSEPNGSRHLQSSVWP